MSVASPRSRSTSATSRQAGARAHRLQRAARRRRYADHRRLPHPRRAADDRLADRARRDRGDAPATSAGRRAQPDPKYSMEPVRARLAELAPGVELLENLRFDPGEDGQRPGVRRQAGRRHRRCTSTTRSARRTVPTPRSSARRRRCRRRWVCCCRRRSTCCSACATSPKHPFVAVLGGAKISDKLGVVEALLDVVDSLVIGGAMCFTFFAAQGKPIGDSLFEPDQVDTCGACSPRPRLGKTIHLPDDIVGVDAIGQVRHVRHPPARRCQGLRHRPGLGGRVQRHRSWMPARCSGTARWACSKTSASPPARARVAQAMADTKAFTVVGGGDSRRGARPVPARRRRRPRVHRRRRDLELLELGDLPGPRSAEEGTQCRS